MRIFSLKPLIFKLKYIGFRSEIVMYDKNVKQNKEIKEKK